MEIDTFDKRFSKEVCMKCGSKNLTDKIYSNGSWTADYMCKDCGSNHYLNIGDSMGGQPSVIDYD